jgi:hypothetical protein
MSSPLLEQANAYIFLDSQDDVTLVNGRLTVASASRVVFHAFLKRESSGAGSSVAIATGEGGVTLPGITGQGFRYGGYVLRYAVMAGPVDPDELPAAQDWVDITASLAVGSTQDVAFQPGRRGQCLLGSSERLQPCVLESTTGDYGGTGVDELLYLEIGGIPVSVVLGEVFGA